MSEHQLRDAVQRAQDILAEHLDGRCDSSNALQRLVGTLLNEKVEQALEALDANPDLPSVKLWLGHH
jgi:hypothetical protein